MSINEFPEGEIRRGCKYVLNAQQVDWLRYAAERISNERIAERIGVSKRTVNRLFDQHGIVRSEAAVSRIMKHTYKAKIKDKLKWYHESLKGVRPSDACLNAYWEKRHQGLIDPPIVALKKKNPKRYMKCMQRRSEQRKELRKQERMRVEVGLSQHTKIHTPEVQYTSKQRSTRYNMKRRGYILGDISEKFCERYVIYYDADTERSKICERNALRCGFKIELLDE